MPDVQLTGNGKVYDKNNILLKSNDVVYSSSKERVSKGKYYYEFTHISGNNYHLIGYSSNNGYIAFYPQNNLPSSKIYYSGLIKCNYSGNLNLKDVDNLHTVGVGLDLDNYQFYIRTKTSVRRININRDSRITTWNIILVEATGGSFTDICSVNFGEKRFAYKVPFGFIPWRLNSAPTVKKRALNFSILNAMVMNIIVNFTM